MPGLWEEDGMPVWIDSDSGTFVLCWVLCACWIGGRIGVDGSWIGGKEAVGCGPFGQSLKAAENATSSRWVVLPEEIEITEGGGSAVSLPIEI